MDNFSVSDFSFDAAADQLAAFLGDIRNSTTTHVGGHGTLCNFYSTVNTAFMTVFKCGSLSDSSRVSRLMRSIRTPRPNCDRGESERLKGKLGIGEPVVVRLIDPILDNEAGIPSSILPSPARLRRFKLAKSSHES